MSFKQILKKYKPFVIAFIIPIILIIMIGLMFLAGYFIQWIWAETISDIFGVKEISYWQAIGILVLSKILFGNSFQVTKSSSKKKHGRNDLEFSTGRKNVNIELGDEEDNELAAEN